MKSPGEKRLLPLFDYIIFLSLRSQIVKEILSFFTISSKSLNIFSKFVGLSCFALFLKCRLLGQSLSSAKLRVCFIILSLFTGLFTCRLDEQASGGTEEESSQTGKMSSSIEVAAPPRAASTPPPATTAPPVVDREASPGLLGEGNVAATVFNSPSARTPNKHSKARQNNKTMVMSNKDSKMK